MLRPGVRNRTRDGLQQSYGDHNRLLMLALDRLLAGDADWLRDHVTAGTTVDEDSLHACVAAAGDVVLSGDEQLALWLGAALHDCGMLRSPDAHVDVEDGVVLARPLLAEYCPATTRALAEFALRHHDYVKDAFLGEAPVGFIADDLTSVAPDLRALAVIALGLIQVAGAASLGEGRLSDFRLDIFHACIADRALVDRSNDLRLARLLAPAPDTRPKGAVVPDVAAARAMRAALASEDRAEIDGFLERAFVHGWHGFTRSVAPPERFVTLRRLAALNCGWGADHLVIDDGLRDRGDGRIPSNPSTVRHAALTGRVVVTILP